MSTIGRITNAHKALPPNESGDIKPPNGGENQVVSSNNTPHSKKFDNERILCEQIEKRLKVCFLEAAETAKTDLETAQKKFAEGFYSSELGSSLEQILARGNFLLDTVRKEQSIETRDAFDNLVIRNPYIDSTWRLYMFSQRMDSKAFYYAEEEEGQLSKRDRLVEDIIPVAKEHTKAQATNPDLIAAFMEHRSSHHFPQMMRTAAFGIATRLSMNAVLRERNIIDNLDRFRYSSSRLNLSVSKQHEIFNADSNLCFEFPPDSPPEPLLLVGVAFHEHQHNDLGLHYKLKSNNAHTASTHEIISDLAMDTVTYEVVNKDKNMFYFFSEKMKAKEKSELIHEQCNSIHFEQHAVARAVKYDILTQCKKYQDELDVAETLGQLYYAATENIKSRKEKNELENLHFVSFLKEVISEVNITLKEKGFKMEAQGSDSLLTKDEIIEFFRTQDPTFQSATDLTEEEILRINNNFLIKVPRITIHRIENDSLAA